MLQKIKSLSLERQLFLSFSAVSALLLMLSLGITLYFDIARQSQSIDSTISSTAAYVASMDGVAEYNNTGFYVSYHYDQLQNHLTYCVSIVHQVYLWF